MIYFPPQPRPYAETHYRFRAAPVSRYFRPLPEIIADMPRRLEPGYDLPILIIVKDAHRFPVKIHSAKIQWCDPGLPIQEFPLDKIIDIPYWSELLTLPAGSLPRRRLELDIIIRASRHHREFQITNHNYVGIPHSPFKINLSEHPFPKLPGQAIGDLHVHTCYTDDQVEFGAPLHATAHIAHSMGHDFVAITDHSYDLDDTWDNYLINDPDLPKYKKIAEEIERWNREHPDSIQIIPGEEVSAGNHRHRNVHLLVLGNGAFLPGTGDGAETWLHTRPELSIPQIIERLENHRVAIAAHPDYQFPFLERFFLRRDTWHQKDFLHPGLTGIQITKGHDPAPFQKGITLWTKLLLQGHRLSLTTGTDAHGNFNHYIQIKTPMISLEKAGHSVFGEVLTLIPSSKPLSVSSLLSEIKKCRTGITTGPGIDFHIHSSQDQDYLPGNTCPLSTGAASIQAISSPEFGAISHTLIWAGNPKIQAEELVWIEQPSPPTYHLEREIPIEARHDWNYLRAEIRTQLPQGIERALTGAIFLSSTKP